MGLKCSLGPATAGGPAASEPLGGVSEERRERAGGRGLGLKADTPYRPGPPRAYAGWQRREDLGLGICGPALG